MQVNETNEILMYRGTSDILFTIKCIWIQTTPLT